MSVRIVQVVPNQIQTKQHALLVIRVNIMMDRTVQIATHAEKVHIVQIVVPAVKELVKTVPVGSIKISKALTTPNVQHVVMDNGPMVKQNNKRVPRVIPGKLVQMVNANTHVLGRPNDLRLHGIIV